MTAAQAHLGFEQSFLGIDGHLAQIKQKTRQYGAYADVAKKGYSSLQHVQRMAEVAEEAKQQAKQEEIEPPTPEALAAKRASYETLTAKELRQLCSERSPSVSTAGCLEKADIVDRLMKDDERVFVEKANAAMGGHGMHAGGGGGGGDMEEPELSPEAQRKMAESMEASLQESLPTFLETMVSASLLDVEVTLKAACNKVTADTSVDKEVRIQRAQAMLLLGRAFLQAKGATPSARGEVEAKHVFEGTMMKTMAKAQGQEVNYDEEFIPVSEMIQEPEPEDGKAMD